jgi:phospholipid/cholesterol/gamma-HCH transport system ATP-binding protein
MIQLLDVSKRFLDNVVLDGVSLEVRDGETVALLGPSGVGKSVTLKTINRLLRPDAGDVIVDGLHVQRLKRKELAELRARIGYVFQHGALFDSDSVYQNIRLGITNEDQYNDEAFCAERVKECLRLVNLPPEVADKYPAELSGGMKKRVGLARALVLDPEVMLYDEPTTGLDPIMSDVINELILQTRRRTPITSVVVTHELKTVLKVADRVVMLYPLARLKADEPQILFDGTPDELRACPDPRVRQFVEGEARDRLAELRD